MAESTALEALYITIDPILADLWRYVAENENDAVLNDNTIPREDSLCLPCKRYIELGDDEPARYCDAALLISFRPELAFTVMDEEKTQRRKSISGSRIRYAKLLQRDLLLLSYYDVDGEVAMMYLELKSEDELHRALNGLRRAIFVACNHNLGQLKNFFPLYSNIIWVDIIQESQQSCQQMQCVIDQQCLSLFQKPMSSVPTKLLYFYKEPGPNVVNKMVWDENTRRLTVSTTGSHTYVFHLQPGKPSHVTEEVPQHTEIPQGLRFGELLAALRFVKTRSKRFWRGNSQFHTDAAQDKLQELQVSGSTRTAWHCTWETDGGGRGETFPGWGLYDRDMEIALTESVNEFGLLGKMAEKTSEEMQEWWNVAEATINSIRSEGLVPWSAMESGGLDPNSVDHVAKCIDEIQGALFDQNYGQALSVVQGLQREFKSSKFGTVREIANMDEMTLLKRIYFKI